MNNRLTVHIYSFGYRVSGIPADDTDNNGGFVFDCRFLPNPGREEKYRSLTGKDTEVIEYFSKHEIVDRFLEYMYKIIDMAVENYQSRQFTDLTISFGCTGGQHRSVYCAEKCAAYLRSKNIHVEVHHAEFPHLDENQE